MKKMWKSALVALMAFAMLFSFTACSDDDDEPEVELDLTDTQVVTIVAQGFAGALTSAETSYYDADGNAIDITSSTNTATPASMVLTVSSDYSTQATLDMTTYYTVAIASGSSVTLSYGTDYNKVVVDVDAAIEGVAENLDLTAYLNTSYSVLTSTDNADYAIALTINGEATDLNETAISYIVSSLITQMTGGSSSGTEA